MNSSSQCESAAAVSVRGSFLVRTLWFAIGYCGVSSLTLPFMDRVWFCELPVFAVVQLPKVSVASWLCSYVVTKAIAVCGFSRGSFSADYYLARPYGLAIAYLVPMIVLGVIGLRRSRFKVDKSGLLMLTFFIVASVDFVFTLLFTHRGSLKIF